MNVFLRKFLMFFVFAGWVIYLVAVCQLLPGSSSACSDIQGGKSHIGVVSCLNEQMHREQLPAAAEELKSEAFDNMVNKAFWGVDFKLLEIDIDTGNQRGYYEFIRKKDKQIFKIFVRKIGEKWLVTELKAGGLLKPLTD